MFKTLFLHAAILAFGGILSSTSIVNGQITPVAAPTDPVGAEAFDILKRHCARCHQDGLLEEGRSKPSSNFGNILDIANLLQQPEYVVPGNPDASKLYATMQSGEMPYDVASFERFDGPTPEEITAIRNWIENANASEVAECKTRDHIDPVETVRVLTRDLDDQPDHRVRTTRYITLTHLYNGCVDDETMNVYRQGVVKLLNSLSRRSTVVKLNTVDDAQSVIRFNLLDLGWGDHEWDSITAVYPYAILPDSQLAKTLEAVTGTSLPMVRGDWFAFTASQPPLYDKLLQLPDTFQGLQAQLGVDVEQNIRNYLAQRAGFQDSGVSQNNRMMERHDIATGYFWTSYDFAGNKERQSLFEFPLGPNKTANSFDHDGGESIFSLPNGFQGYYLNDAAGNQLDKGPTEIVRDKSRRDFAVTNGISCMGCHDVGIRMKRDEIREFVDRNFTFSADVRDQVLALYPPVEEMDRILQSDLEKFKAAMRSAGLDPELKSNGVEMINALAHRYEQDVVLTAAAAEFGQSEEQFQQSLMTAGDPLAARLGRRLSQGSVPRDTFESLFNKIVERVSDLRKIEFDSQIQTIEIASPTRPVSDKRDFDLALTSDKDFYQKDDLAVFTVSTDHDCYLTLINVDQKSQATVIFPNQFEQDNRLIAGKIFNLPNTVSDFQFRLADSGVETVIALCSTDNLPVDGVNYTFDQIFTDLGEYADSLTKAIEVETRNRRQVPVTQRGIVARRAIKVVVK